MPNALSPSGGSIALTLPTSSSRTTRTTSPTTTAATGASVKRASPNSPSLPLAPASSSGGGGGGGAGPAPLGTTSLLANKAPPALPARSQAWHDAGSSQQQQQQQPSGMAAASSAPAATSPPQLQVPGYAQRDELASQIWAAAREGGNAEWLTLLGLARLASQHHLSPYNCLKHGAKGSPYAYLPITLQQPQLVAETMDKQRFNEARAAEWLQRKRCRAVEMREREEARVATEAAAKQQANDDEDQIMASASCGVKRPLSALSQGSADALEPRQVARAMAFDEPPSSSSGGDGMEHALRDAMSSSLRTSALPDAANAGSSIEMTGPLGVEVIQTQEKEQTVMQPHAASVAPQQINAATTVAQLPAAAQHALAMKTSDTHPINISPIVPPELLSSVSSQIYAVLPACVQDCHTHRPPQITDASSMLSARPAIPTPSADAPDVHAARQVAGERLIRLAASVDLVQMAADEEAAQRAAHFQLLQQNAPPGSVVLRPDAQSPVAMVTACNVAALPAAPTGANGEGTAATATTQGLMMGNLLLSSCPGKKVRLTGPVRGRGAICRDLGLDLRRIRGIGVGAVICCLDDEELAFLGAPWEEYEREADALGMDVVRLPMAEGFAPTCVRTTDAAMTSIVSDYTLRGIHVLVHCRGGVGRAGLIACTWMCKLGLVRSAEVEQSTPALAAAAAAAAAASTSNAQAQTTESNAEPRGCEDTQVYSTVERLVNTIRRRRSPKAIETAEQVKFIVDYVTYLHQQEQLHRASAQNSAASRLTLLTNQRS